MAESRRALPVVALYAVIALLAGGAYFCSATDYTVALPLVGDTRLYVHHSTLAQMLMLALCTAAMLTLTTRHSMIRIYSRMDTCSYLMLSVMSVGVLFQFQPPAGGGEGWGIIHCYAVQLCLLLFYTLIFDTYQKPGARGKLFAAFVCIGVASLFFIQIVLLVPLLWLFVARNMMVTGPRVLAASLMGVLLPYWFLAAFCVLTGDVEPLARRASSLSVFVMPGDWRLAVAGVDVNTLVTTAFILLLSVTGMVHFARNSYKDRIRVRMIYEFIMCVSVSAAFLAAAQPQHILMVLGILIVNASLLTGHYIALTSTRCTSVSVVALIAVTLGITVFNVYGCSV